MGATTVKAPVAKPAMSLATYRISTALAKVIIIQLRRNGADRANTMGLRPNRSAK
jgi:hypothetical protein